MVEFENGQKCWAFGSGQYVDKAVPNVLVYHKKRDEGLTDKAPTLMSSGCLPEIDTPPELGEEDAVYFHSPIRVLR